MPTRNRWTPAHHAVLRGTMILLSVVLTILLRLALSPLLGSKASLIMFFPALVFSAWAGGWAGGLTALGLSALAATYFFISPHHNLSIASKADQLTLFIFVVVGLSVSALSNSQRRAHQQAQQSVAVLRASEARKSAVLEVALDCIITADEQGRILEFNPAAEQTFGYARDEVLGRLIADVIIPPALREAHLRGLEHFRNTGEGPILRQRIEVTGMRRDGSEFPVEIAIIPTSGDGIEFTAYLRDITQSKSNQARQRAFLRDVLASVTEGHLLLCDTPDDLPALPGSGESPVLLTQAGGLRELRLRAQEAARAAGHSEERQHDLLTAVSEAGMNAIVHGGGGTGRVAVSASGLVQVRVEDQGMGIAVENLPRAALARGFSTKATLGHGLKMMLETVDRLFLLTGATGTTVVLEQERDLLLPPWL